MNGLFAGFAEGGVLRFYGIGAVVSGTIAHGVFEIPATILAGVVGVELGKLIWKPSQPHKIQVISKALPGSSKVLILVVFLFFLASLAESLVSPKLLLSSERVAQPKAVNTQIVKSPSTERAG